MNLTPRTRRRVYDLTNAGLGVAVVYGLATGEQAAAWLLLVSAVLGMARANVEAE